MEILLGTNAECSRNFSQGIIPTFYWIFSYGKKFKLLRKDFDPSYLRIGLCCSIVKNLLPVVNIQNGALIQDGRQNVFID
jgi:hypothetical protein